MFFLKLFFFIISIIFYIKYDEIFTVYNINILRKYNFYFW